MMHLAKWGFLGLLLSVSPAGAAEIACGPSGGRIQNSTSAIVWVASDDVLLLVTEEPSRIPDELSRLADFVTTPTAFCTDAWIIPAPHPGDPEPEPVPDLTPPRFVRHRTGNLTAHVTPGWVTPEVHPDGGNDSELDTDDPSSGAVEAPAADEPGPVVIAVVEEPTPTPAEPAPPRGAYRAGSGSCGVSPAGGASHLGLLGLLGLAIRRRRGGR